MTSLLIANITNNWLSLFLPMFDDVLDLDEVKLIKER